MLKILFRHLALEFFFCCVWQKIIKAIWTISPLFHDSPVWAPLLKNDSHKDRRSPPGALYVLVLGFRQDICLNFIKTSEGVSHGYWHSGVAIYHGNLPHLKSVTHSRWFSFTLLTILQLTASVVFAKRHSVLIIIIVS